jgi:hypothetical protein
MSDEPFPASPSAFLRARFAGGRFDSHTMPMEMLPDIASYRRLIVEVAKHLFKETHGARVRVPKGFEDSFRLSVATIIGGSSSVVELVRLDPKPRGKTSQLFATHAEFDQARDLVAEVIKRVSSGQKIPETFPASLVGLFNPFGQNLLPEEYIEIPTAHGGIARYTDGVRRSIVLSAEQIYEHAVDAEFTLNGGVVDTGTIHVRDNTGRSLDFQSASQFEFDEAFRRAKSKARLVGTGLFDSNDTLRRLLSVSVHFDKPAFHLEVRRSFEEARSAVDFSAPPRSQAIADVATNLERAIQDVTDPNFDLGAPYVYLLEDGSMSVEWSYGAWEAGIEVDATAASLTMHALNSTTSQSLWSKFSTSDHSRLEGELANFFSTLTADSAEE